MLLLASKNNKGGLYDALDDAEKKKYDMACKFLDKAGIEALPDSGITLPGAGQISEKVVAALKASCKKTNPLLMYQMMQGNKSMSPAMMLALAGNNGGSSMDPLTLLALSGGKMDSNAMMMLALSNQGGSGGADKEAMKKYMMLEFMKKDPKQFPYFYAGGAFNPQAMAMMAGGDMANMQGMLQQSMLNAHGGSHYDSDSE